MQRAARDIAFAPRLLQIRDDQVSRECLDIVGDHAGAPAG